MEYEKRIYSIDKIKKILILIIRDKSGNSYLYMYLLYNDYLPNVLIPIISNILYGLQKIGV